MAMHACQIGPTDTALPCPGWPQRACVETKWGTLWGRPPFCPHFSSATQVCGWCDYISLCFGINQDLRISGLDGKLAARCPRSRPVDLHAYTITKFSEFLILSEHCSVEIWYHNIAIFYFAMICSPKNLFH